MSIDSQLLRTEKMSLLLFDVVWIEALVDARRLLGWRIDEIASCSCKVGEQY